MHLCAEKGEVRKSRVVAALSTLPTELAQLIQDTFRDACYASSVGELCTIRLVNARLAATFYKRDWPSV